MKEFVVFSVRIEDSPQQAARNLQCGVGVYFKFAR